MPSDNRRLFDRNGKPFAKRKPTVARNSVLEPKEVAIAQFGPRDLKPKDSKEYAIQTLYFLKQILESEEWYIEKIEQTIREIDEAQHWLVLGYQDRESMFKAELAELPAAARLKLTRAEEAIAQAVVDGNTKPLATHAEAGAKGGKTAGRGRPKDPQASYNITSLRGTSASYKARRLKRDFPAIFARLEAGEFRSVRQAAIAAGIEKVKTPLDELRRWWEKASQGERETFRKEIGRLRA